MAGAQKRVRRNEEVSKSFMIESTLELINKNGWENFSMRKLAAKCGMSPSNVVYHFESNEALMLALLNSISAKNYAIVERGQHDDMSAFELLMNHYRGNLKWVEKNPAEAHVVLLIYSRAPFDKAFANVFNIMVARAQERIRTILEYGRAANEFYFKESAAEMAETLHQLLLGASIYQLSGRKLKDIDADFQKIEISLRRMLAIP